jgi:F0F1-type ATP synthase assembly protein I
LINKNTTKSIFAYSTLGIQLAFFMVLFVYGGFRLDSYLNTSPLFVALGAVIGFGGGIYNLVSGLSHMDRMSKEESSTKQKKNRWL